MLIRRSLFIHTYTGVESLTKIGFIRHGNTDWNIEKRAQGHSNNPINEMGLQQAHAIGKRLEQENWDMIISSDLLRAKKTAEIIASYINLPIKLDQRIRERDRGGITGTIEEERVMKWGKDWREIDFGKDRQETSEEVRARGVDFVYDVLDQYQEKKILVVTHGKLLNETLLALCPETTAERDLVRNSSMTIIKEDNGTFDYLIYNCSCHLDAEQLTR